MDKNKKHGTRYYPRCTVIFACLYRGKKASLWSRVAQNWKISIYRWWKPWRDGRKKKLRSASWIMSVPTLAISKGTTGEIRSRATPQRSPFSRLRVRGSSTILLFSIFPFKKTSDPTDRYRSKPPLFALLSRFVTRGLKINSFFKVSISSSPLRW